MLTKIRSFIRQHPDLTILLVFLAGLALAHVVLDTHPTALDSPEALQERLTAGQPTVVEFYSNL